MSDHDNAVIISESEYDLEDLPEPKSKGKKKSGAVIRDPQTAATLMNTNLPPIKFYIDQIAPQGVGFLSGAPKVGKSFLAVEMCWSVATGNKFLDLKTEKVPVIYYSLEMGQELLQSRLKKMFCWDAAVKDLNIFYSLPPYEEGTIAQIELDIGMTGAKFIVIDTFAYVSKSKSSQKPLYEETVKEISEYKRLADEYGITIVFVSHLKKGTSFSDDDFDLMMGSQGNRGTTDFNILYRKDPEDPARLLFIEESRKAAPTELIVKRTPQLRTMVIGTADEVQMTNHREIYEKNPIVRTVKHLLTGKNKVEMTASDFNDEMIKLCGADARGYEFDGRTIKPLQNDLYHWDLISYTYRNSGGRWHTFTQNELPGKKDPRQILNDAKKFSVQNEVDAK